MQNASTSTQAIGDYQPRRVFHAMRKLIADPTETAHVFTIIEALAGSAPMRVHKRFTSEAGGRRLLASRPNLITYLADRATLEALPEDTLGRAYLRFVDREGITPDGLVEASIDGETGRWRSFGDEIAWITNRLRDSHDLWHVVTGYGGDVLGETALLGFSSAQTTNPGVALMALAATLRSFSGDVARRVVAAFGAGRRAQWMVALEWEQLLAMPLAELRSQLHVTPVAPYVRMRPDWKREAVAA